MNRWVSLAWRSVVVTTAMVVGFALVGSASVRAAETDDSASTEKIEPYTGPPIFLDQPEPEPPSKMVERQVKTVEYGNGKVRVERQIARFSDDHLEADGFYHEYFPNGQKFIEGQYKAGRQDGKWTYWYDNGKVNREVMYHDGQPDGSWEVHRADETLSEKRGYKAGRRDGIWVYYDKTGKQPTREESYQSGKADGVWKFWYPNGQPQSQLTFKEGRRNGPATEWYEKGEKRVEVNYVDDLLDGTTTAWTPEGKKIVQEYNHGKLVKESKQ